MLDRPYMKDRGCETTKTKGEEDQPSWGFEYDGYTWPKKCVPGAHDYSPSDTTSKVTDANKCNAVGDCANHEATSMHAGTYCSRKRGSSSTQKYCVEKEQDFMSTWWAPVDITCFKGQQWNNVLGMGGSCTSDDQCCSGYCEISGEKTESCFGACHPDGKNCRGAVTNTVCTARCPASHGEKCGTRKVADGTTCTARCPYSKGDKLTTTYTHYWDECVSTCPKNKGDVYKTEYWLGKRVDWTCGYKYCWNNGVACGTVWSNCTKTVQKSETRHHTCEFSILLGERQGSGGCCMWRCERQLCSEEDQLQDRRCKVWRT